MWVGYSSASFLSFLIAGGLKHPDPHPAEESPAGNSSSPSNTVQAQHRESYTHWYLWNVMLFPPQHLMDLCQADTLQPLNCQELEMGSPQPSLSSSCLSFILSCYPIPGCCTHREAMQLSTGAADAVF